MVSEPILIFPDVARQIAVSSDNRSVLTGSMAGYTFYVFDIKTGQLRFSLSGFDAAFSADGKRIFVVNEDAINAYDAETGKLVRPILNAVSNYMTRIVVSPNGKLLAVNNTSRRQYQLVALDNSFSIGDMPDSISDDLRFSQDGKLMAEISDKPGASEFRFWDLSNGSELAQKHGLIPRQGYTNPTFNSDFSQIATYDIDGYFKYIYLWDVQKSSLISAFPLPSTKPPFSEKRTIIDLGIISDDQLLFAREATPDEFLFWDIQTGKLLSEFSVEIHNSELGNPIAFSPDGRLILLIDGDGTIRVWGVK